MGPNIWTPEVRGVGIPILKDVGFRVLRTFRVSGVGFRVQP